jgi:hypothetical protein
MSRKSHAAKPGRAIKPTSIREGSLNIARIASRLLEEPITDFLSKASDARALRVIKRHNVLLPPSAVPFIGETST